MVSVLRVLAESTCVESKNRKHQSQTSYWTYQLLTSLSILLLLSAYASTNAATLPKGFAETRVAGNLADPTAMTFAPDGRLFVAQQGGQLRVIKNGQLLATPFLTLNVNREGERGLLGVTLDPNFTANGYVYVYYTVPSPVHNRVSRFTANGDVAATNSEQIIFELDNLSGATNHNGGALHFGPDGKLYIAVGENAYPDNAQTLTNLHGKMLRINADGSIPSDNPFRESTSGKNVAIWALGLRNPFTFAFQPGTSRMFINDVGQDAWEEINEGAARANYGWPRTEGYTSDSNFRSPRYAYNHNAEPGTCAITGGVFYNPPTRQFPQEYVGRYFFADYCGGWIKVVDPTNSSTVAGFASGISAAVDLRVSADGSLYYLARGNGGGVYKIQYTASEAPSIGTQPTNQTVPVNRSATFSVTASGSAPLSYQWQRNGVNIANATSPSYTTPAATQNDNGAQFRVIVTNPSGRAESAVAVLNVTTNRAPVGTITTPAQGTLYTAGQPVAFSGTASDPEEGELPASNFTWQVDFYGGADKRPFVPSTPGSRSGSFTPATRQAYTEADAFYRITLTVKDSQGQEHTSARDVKPRTANITLASAPTGLQVTLDGQPKTAPFTVKSVVGLTRTLGVVSPQTVNGVTYQFSSWSDGGSASHNVNTPATDTTYTANYQVGSGGTTTLPGSWTTQDIGSTNLAGSAAYDNETFTVKGSGDDIWGTADAFRYVHQPLVGDGQIVARVASIDNTDQWAKAGVMIRESLAANARQAMMVVTPGNGVAFQCRAITGGASTHSGSSGSAPQWVKLVRLGSSFSGYSSPDGSNWTLVSSTTVEMGSPVYVGLAVTAHNNSALNTSAFSNVNITNGGVGLTGEYFHNNNLTDLALTRTDGIVNFHWNQGAPASSIDSDTFSVRWTGYVQPRYSETYTFYTVSDDGVRLWINNQLVIDNWSDHQQTENSASVALLAGRKYSIRMEFYENYGDATAKLLWSSASQAKEVVPQSHLYAAGSLGVETFLSDLAEVAVSNGWGAFEKDRSNGERGASDGRTISLNAATYAKGLGVHADSEIVYNLGGGYTTFISDIGVDDEVGDKGSVMFEVWVDGEKFYSSALITGTSATETVTVNVAGKRELKLIVKSGGDNYNFDHADWAGARLIR